VVDWLHDSTENILRQSVHVVRSRLLRRDFSIVNIVGSCMEDDKGRRVSREASGTVCTVAVALRYDDVTFGLS
jgi:hypothetical protein